MQDFLSTLKVLREHYRNCRRMRALLARYDSERLRNLYWYAMTIHRAASLSGFLRVATAYLRRARQNVVANYYGAGTLYWAAPHGDGLDAPALTVWTCRGLETTPWHANDDVWARRLAAGFDAILADYRKVEQRRRPNPASAVDVDLGRWDNIFLTDVHGRINAEFEAECRDTYAVISDFPLCTNFGFAFFSETAPDTHIKAHTGGSNLRLRYHLPLDVKQPEHNRMRVGKEIRSWTEGKVTVFDDSFDHEVWNDGQTRRTLLIVDLWHPSLSDSDIACLSDPLFNRFGKID